MDNATEVAAGHLATAAQKAREGVQNGHGGPFGAVVVHNAKPIAIAANEVLLRHDPTAHAEILAIRAACRHLQTPHLRHCTLYTTCYPCPMCMGAVLWARLPRVVYAATPQEAALAGFDDQAFYQHLEKKQFEAVHLAYQSHAEVSALFAQWQHMANDRHTY